MKKILLALFIVLPIVSLAQRYHIGDTIWSSNHQRAIVFHVSDDGNYGWAVATKDYQSEISFATVSGNEIPCLEPILPPSGMSSPAGYANVLEDYNGYHYTKVLRESGNAATYPAAYAVDFENGWYLPTIGQLRKLYASKIQVADIINRMGGNWLPNYSRKYLSSTAKSYSDIWTLAAHEGTILNLERSYEAAYIRPMINFGCIYNDTIDLNVCKGVRINRLGYIFYATEDTLISKAYKSYNGYDSIVNIRINVFAPDIQLSGNMAVCEGSNTTITATGADNYNWFLSSEPNTSLSINDYITLTNITSPNTYAVTGQKFMIEPNDKCSDTKTFYISTISTGMEILGDNVVCYNSPATLSTSGGNSFEWFAVDNPSVILGTGSTFTTQNLTDNTTFGVNVSGGTCNGSGNITVNVQTPLSTQIYGDNSICYNSNTYLYADIPSDNERVEYSWYNIENPNTILSTENYLETENLYTNTTFGLRIEKTSGVAPSASEIAVGDIITTNNVHVKPIDWISASSQGFNAAGIICNIDNDNIRIISIDEYENVRWGFYSEDITGNTYFTTSATAQSDLSGEATTGRIVSYNESSSNPIDAQYSAALTANNYGEGWYLPACGELYNLGLVSETINATLEAVNGTEFANDKNYWSATEFSSSNAWYVYNNYPNAVSKNNENGYYVRPMKSLDIDDIITFSKSTTCDASATMLVQVEELRNRTIYDTISLGETFTLRDSTLTFSNAGDFNFDLIFHNAYDCDSIYEIHLFVEPTIINVTPTANLHKNCGENDPTFTYTTSPDNIELTGNLSRESGENVGIYPYNIGDLSAGDNYMIIITGNSYFEILPVYATDTRIECDSYTWEGTTYTESGTYTKTLQSAAGCDSIVTLNLTIKHAQENIQYAEACDSYTWRTILGNHTYTESGIYHDTIVAFNGCDSILTLNLTIKHSIVNDIYVNSCDRYYWDTPYGMINFSESGTYTINFNSSENCDSTVNLHLTIGTAPAVPTATSTDNTLCNGGYNGTITVLSPLGAEYEYSIDGENFQSNTLFENVTTGNYTLSARRVGELCTSTTDITVGTTIYRPEIDMSAITNSICENEDIYLDAVASTGSMYYYSWSGPNGFTSSLMNPTISSARTENSGVYSLTVSNITNGCDHTESINITVNEHDYTTFEHVACESFTWIDGNTYYESTNNPVFILTNSNGCDSIVTLNLTIHHNSDTTINISICGNDFPYIFNDQTYNQAGNYTQHLSTINSCDSTIYLNITSTEYYENNIAVTICENELPYSWNGNIYEEGGEFTYSYTSAGGCDSIVNFVLTISEMPDVTIEEIYVTGASNHMYLEAHGADTYLWSTGDRDSQIVLMCPVDGIFWVIGYNENMCSDTAEIELHYTDIRNNRNIGIDIYPNPTSSICNVKCDIENAEIQLYDAAGKCILLQKTKGKLTEINVSNLAQGTYVLQIIADGKNVGMAKIVKE